MGMREYVGCVGVVGKACGNSLKCYGLRLDYWCLQERECGRVATRHTL